jgi:hypothetical protein
MEGLGALSRFMSLAFRCLELHDLTPLVLHWQALDGSECIEVLLLQFFQIEKSAYARLWLLDDSSSFTWLPQCLILCVLNQKDHQERGVVVPVLMTNCHVSLKPNIGPVTIHAAMTPTAGRTSWPTAECAAAFANQEITVLRKLELSLGT